MQLHNFTLLVGVPLEEMAYCNNSPAGGCFRGRKVFIIWSATNCCLLSFLTDL